MISYQIYGYSANTEGELPKSAPSLGEPPLSETLLSESPLSEPPTSEPPTSEPPTSEPPTSEPRSELFNDDQETLDSAVFRDLSPVLWLNNGQLDDEDCNFFFHRVDSDQIIYQEKKRRCKMLGKYVMGDLLGEGSYGKVKELMDSLTLTRLAVKILKKRKLRRIPNGEENVKREMRLLHGLQHKNVIRLVDTLINEEKQKLYMIFEFCLGGLQELLDSAPDKCVPAWQAHGYLHHICAGLAYLHSRRIVHKDIKPGNLLIALDGTLKITDLGVAEAFALFAPDDAVCGAQGTPAFQPPEVAAGLESFSGFKLDVWSTGVTLFNFVTGRYPFQGDNVYRLFEAIAGGKFQVPAEVEPELSHLIRGMLCKDPIRRFSLAQVMSHPWYLGQPALTGTEVPLPLRLQDSLHSSTVIPYLMAHHYGPDDPGAASLLNDQTYVVPKGGYKWKNPRWAEYNIPNPVSMCGLVTSPSFMLRRQATTFGSVTERSTEPSLPCIYIPGLVYYHHTT